MAPQIWRRLRQIAQFLALLFFLYLFVITFQAPHPEGAILFQRLDPLTTLAASLAGRTLVAGFWLALLTLAVTLVFGPRLVRLVLPLGHGPGVADTPTP